jgi:peptide/nickel transport system permease protein
MSLQYVISRLWQTVIVMFLVTVLTFFFLTVLPGDPVTLLIGPENAATMTPEDIERAREDLGLNDPIPVRYVEWLGGIITGDWGTSVRTRAPVLESIQNRAPVTLQLAAFAWVVSLLVAIPVGVGAALMRNSWFDRGATLLATGGVAMPNFWLAILMILLFAVRLDWLPASGYVSPLDDPGESFKHFLMPAVVLGLAQAATVMRQTRSSMLEVMGQDYIRTARAKGLSSYTVAVRHGLRNAMLPVITVLGLRLGNLLGGSVIIESVFAIPGMGRLAVNAIFTQDFPVVMGFVLLIALVVSMASLVTDLVYGLADPRIQLSRSAA